jgi:hypothetical protein
MFDLPSDTLSAEIMCHHDLVVYDPIALHLFHYPPVSVTSFSPDFIFSAVELTFETSFRHHSSISDDTDIRCTLGSDSISNVFVIRLSCHHEQESRYEIGDIPDARSLYSLGV